MKPQVPPPACTLPEIPGVMLFGLLNEEEEGEGMKKNIVAERHAKPLASPHWTGNWGELRNPWRSVKPAWLKPKQIKSEQ